MAANKYPEIVVCDAGPLIHLDELTCLDLLLSFSRIIVPATVWTEVQRHRPSALRRRRVKLERLPASQDASRKLLQVLERLPLDAGEHEALLLMQQFPTAMLLSDDGVARAVAQQLGYEVHGTIGIILAGMRDGLRTRRQVLNVLRKISTHSTLHVARQLLQGIIDQVQDRTP